MSIDITADNIAARANEGFKLISGADWANNANYDNVFPLLNQLYQLVHGKDAELPLEVYRAASFAIGAHAGRVRKGIRKRPYWHHLAMVWFLAVVMDLPLDYQVAAWHHDDVEDLPKHWGRKISQDGVLNLIATISGFGVASIAKSMTNEELGDGETKHQMQMRKVRSMRALVQILKLLDRIANLYDMRQDKPKSFGPQRIQQEIDNAYQLHSACQNPSDKVKALLDWVVAMLKTEHDLAVA